MGRAAIAGILLVLLATPGRVLAITVPEPTGAVAATARSAGRPLPPVRFHGERGERVVALTFDDGYGAARVRAILAILERERVPATFFPVAIAVRAEPALWRSIARRGYPIGLHGYAHRDLTTRSRRGVSLELVRARTLIERSTGRAIIPILRPPYGAFDRAVVAGAGDAGIAAVALWDVDTRDWSPRVSVRSVIRTGSAGQAGSIVLLHTSAKAVRALPALIAAYRERGFRFVTAGELLGIGGVSPVFPPPHPGAR